MLPFPMTIYPPDRFIPRHSEQLNHPINDPVNEDDRLRRLPHEYATWIGEWHSVPNGDPAMPYAPGTPFVGAVVTPMLNVGPEARTIDVGDGTRINLLALIPLHPAEVELKVSRGTDALIAELDRGGVSELLDPTRPSLV